MIPRFVISHIKNEEYMLPWWINHHKDKFDSGVIIDYNSTDASLDIIRELVPHWTIVPSRNKEFAAIPADLEVMAIESSIQRQYGGSWMMCLNTTEFLIGDTKKLQRNMGEYVRQSYLVDAHVMVDSPEMKMSHPNKNESLVKQRHYGIISDFEEYKWNPVEGKVNVAFNKRKLTDPEFAEHGGPWATTRLSRSLHNYAVDYTKQAGWEAGRHFYGEVVPDFKILWYGYSPYNSEIISRKQAVVNSIPENERARLFTDDKKLEVRFDFYQSLSSDMKDYISKFEPNLWEN